MTTRLQSSWFTVRIARGCCRLIWHRRTAWTLVCLLSLLTLYWQWENWHSARELAAARQRVIQRLGTDEPLKYYEPVIPDADNYFANPLIESWRRPQNDGKQTLLYAPPKEALLPKDFISPELSKATAAGDAETLDLKGWVKARQDVGKPLPPGKSAVEVLASELGDGNGLLPQLAQGVGLPASRMKPQGRELWQAAGMNPTEVRFVSFTDYKAFVLSLALHLRSAALVGDQAKLENVALIGLRFGEAPVEHSLVGALVATAGNEIMMEALHDALNSNAWSEAALDHVRRRLPLMDDLEIQERGLAQDMLLMQQLLGYTRDHRHSVQDVIGGDSSKGPWFFRLAERMYETGLAYGPAGWYDANTAFVLTSYTDIIGPAEPTAWLKASDRAHAVLKRCAEATNPVPNPRHLLGTIAIPNIGNIAEAAAHNLFRRRCLIIGCTLERYRLKHGAFPESLEAVQAELAPYKPMDPALPDKLLRYRLEKDGYLLWSAGPDAQDNSGDAEQDWLWRIKHDASVNP